MKVSDVKLSHGIESDSSSSSPAAVGSKLDHMHSNVFCLTAISNNRGHTAADMLLWFAAHQTGYDKCGHS